MQKIIQPRLDALLNYTVAEIVLSYKNKGNITENPAITCPHDAYDVLIANWDENKIGFIEQVKILLLNPANRVLGICEHSSGGGAGTVIDPKLVFVAAIKANASGIIIAHNHPSGRLKPSLQDRLVTDKLKEGSRILELNFFDHMIVSPYGYYSFAEDFDYDLMPTLSPDN